MKSQTKLIFLLVALIIFTPWYASAKEKQNRTRNAMHKINTGTPKAIANANNVTSWAQSDGFFGWEVSQQWNGEFPRLSGVGTMFSEGIVFGGLVNDGIYSSALRVTGDTYFIGMQSGKILTDAAGNAIGGEPVTEENTRVFAVRADMPLSIEGSPALWPNLATDAATFLKVAVSNVTDANKQAIGQQYFTDWKEWPAAKGAPWYDDRDNIIRNDAAYDPVNNSHHVPGIPGATKTLWFVCNDLDNSITSTFAGSPPIGIEEQMTLWSYASSTPLNNIIFKQVKLIYKGNPGAPSNSQIDSMYIAQWADPDLGDAGDDYAGCDSSELSIGYIWNSSSTDTKYEAIGLAVPASGFSFLQGVSYYTGVSTDSAVVNFQWRKGNKYWLDRPLSAFDYFAANSGISDPDDGTYDGTQQWYNLLRGCLPRPQYPAGIPFYTSSTYASTNNIVTRYCLSGDPTTESGWIDGNDIQSGDRRIVAVHGPFTLKLHDTAEVVVALVNGLGSDNVSSVKVMKNNTTFALRAYKSLFKLPSPPPQPQVSVSELDQKIILNWGGSNSAAVESNYNQGYSFQGYNVYQLTKSSSKLEDATTVKIATYDLAGDNVKVILAPVVDLISGAIETKVVQNGTDGGLKRAQTINKDYIKQTELVNGQAYYFAVTSYSYNPFYNVDSSEFYQPATPALESSPVILSIVPQSTNPGVRHSVDEGEILSLVHTVIDTNKNISDGSVVAKIVQPDKVTGDVYNVTFDAAGTTWSVVDVTKNSDTVLTGTNQSGNDDYKIADGIQFVVQGPPPGMKSFGIPSGTRRFSPVGGFYGLGLEGFSNAGDPTAYDMDNGTIGMAGHFAFGGIGTTLADASEYHTVVLKLAAVDKDALWDPLAAPTDPNFSRAYRWLRSVGATSEPADPSFAAWIINKDAGYPYQDYNYGVPFSAWDMSTTPPTRLSVGMFENNVAVGLLDGRYWPPLTSVDNAGPREFAFIFSHPYSETPDPVLMTNLYANASTPLMWVMVCNRRADASWAAGDEFEIAAAKINSSNDIFTLTAPAVTYDKTAAQVDIERINVFPNPYYGFHSRETNRLNKYVTFNHLPDRGIVTIRIFNLAGVLVRTIQTTPGSQFTRWNLMNEGNLPVASGVYIAHIDMPDLGKSKVLKLAIVQEEQILPTY